MSTAAALHLGICAHNFKILEHFNDFAEAHVKEAAPGLPEVVAGCFGLTLDEDLPHRPSAPDNPSQSFYSRLAQTPGGHRVRSEIDVSSEVG